MTERRTVRIERSPPRRILAPLRWRAMKTAADRSIWEACWAPVLRLQSDGWRLRGVTVDWGKSLPLTAGGRDQAIREVCGCYDACEVSSDASGQGRGTTLVEMTRDE